ncbi:barstar family protein [Kitasatospora sp. NPDC008115]|uniref:barstar family protein n=1 Tax=Kitasatospora sp. NPDC008115 TaxID=3364022 RepID=UPI0036EA9294
MTTVYILDGTRIRTTDDFWRAIGEAVNGPGGYFGRNPDAFADCLGGGFGTPDDDFTVEWRDHQVSREHLGHAETVRQSELLLARCHPSNRPAVAAELAEARAGRGPTVFDRLVAIFEQRVPGALRLL